MSSISVAASLATHVQLADTGRPCKSLNWQHSWIILDTTVLRDFCKPQNCQKLQKLHVTAGAEARAAALTKPGLSKGDVVGT